MAQDLRSFMQQLEQRGELRTIEEPISTHLEMTEIGDRVLRAKGPALLFTQPYHAERTFQIPVLTNLFGTMERVAAGMGGSSVGSLREIGQLLAFLKEPEPPKRWGDLWQFRKALDMAPKVRGDAPCQDVILEGDAVDLQQLPIQHCWPEDAAPLVTWGLTVTQGTRKKRQNIGIYRLQLLNRNQLIMRWLKHRGGALDFRDWCIAHPGEKFPVAVAIGADPAVILAAVTPVPDSLSEYGFAGLLRGARTEVVKAKGSNLLLPVGAEFVLEGYIDPQQTALEGPFGDHTGYYNEQDRFPVFTVERITHRRNPIYHSTYTGRPPDEPAILALALNDVFVPILQKQFPEIVDFYLPSEACSYRFAVISIRKEYPGHAKRIMLGIWSYLRQFMYTKFVIIVDDDIDPRSWDSVIWAMSTRMDPARDTVTIENTPIDYLDFASPVTSLGSKMGFDATNKWPGETNREWGKPIVMTAEVKTKVDQLWQKLGLGS